MIRKVVNIFFVIGIMTAMSCASGSASRSGSQDRDGEHYEDLSDYRPEITIPSDTAAEPGDSSVTGKIDSNIQPQHDITAEMNMLMDSITLLKKDINYVDGFTIQVYTGNSREQANDAKTKVYTTLPDSRPVIIYDQPNFKVKVGKYYTRREAQNIFAQLQKVFSAPIIIPERIPLDKE